MLICTRNEERNLGACLASVAWADDCVVLDSYSDDATVTIAREGGARVVQREFDNFSTHKNWALDHLDFKHDWILIVDADERVTPDLAREIAALVERLAPTPRLLSGPAELVCRHLDPPWRLVSRLEPAAAAPGAGALRGPPGP